MDYSKLSDFEINKMVAVATGARVTESVGFVNTGEDISGHYQEPALLREVTNNRRHWKRYDPCNNPADTWPIIVDKKICIAFDVFHEPQDLGGWVASPAYGWASERVRDVNPLRAAMIVFLMMQEGPNADV